MKLAPLLAAVQTSESFRNLQQALLTRDASAHPVTAIAAARPAIAAALQGTLGRPILMVTARADRAKALASEVTSWSTDPASVYYLAEPDPLFYEHMPWTAETISLRLAALVALAYAGGPAAGSTTAPIVIACVRGLMQRTVPQGRFREHLIRLARGAKLSIMQLLSSATALGYQFEPVVEAPGTVSRRGGIVDVWPPADPQPARIEFLGDEVESIRRFDPSTQRSSQVVEMLNLFPASEVDLTQGPEVAWRVASWDLSNCHPVAQTAWESDRVRLAHGARFRGVEFYLPYFYSEKGSAIDHLPPNGLMLLEDWQELENVAEQIEGQAEEVRVDLETRRESPPGLAPPYFRWADLREQLLHRSRLLFDFQALGESFELDFSVGERYGGQLRKALDEIKQKAAEGSRTVVVTRQSERLAELLRERDIMPTLGNDLTHAPGPGEIALVQGALTEGFIFAPPGQPPLYLLTDAELFGWSRPKPRRANLGTGRSISPEAFFADIGIGDYVVHMDHGIGVFRGLVKMNGTSPEREFLQIEYAQGDVLYVPVHQMDRLARYVAPGTASPALHRLGTAEWSQVKERTKKAIADIAKDLLALYAAREVVPGHAFPDDTTWQHELEASFPYVETEDQLQAIHQVKQDMERARPMDRLVVGDVGYGKTEVALRAAFKAVMDGKQVAVLVPTTVLAQQHLNTFRERLAPFPVSIDMLSRFRSESEQREILRKLQEGGLDIVIGTHRLLSVDVQFKDLGLLIVDEEQRFGVTHKERLKQWRQAVDVLTLTATPIPRTLYMSLSGVRDMSTIQTPPEERLPIRTIVTGFDEGLIRDAILRELDRGGQVFVVHNRVQGIGILTQHLRKLVPEATFLVGHGQMPEEELARVMLDFAAGKADVLVSTTIIESGIDIPNANTIIINHADKFGLAQLYQLRGRVGRSAARAYAYFLYDRNSNVSADAFARLQTIGEANELGAGFQIALRDLELRGAGEILGAQQHGHMAAVGFDFYCRLLASAIEEQRAAGATEGSGTRVAAAVTGSGAGSGPTIDLPLEAEIPEDYIQDNALRIRLYRRLAEVDGLAKVGEFEKEFRDRFGSLPARLENLFFLLRAKALARAAGVAAISLDGGRILIRFTEPSDARAQLLAQLFGSRVRAARDRLWAAGPEADPDWQTGLLDMLARIPAEAPEPAS